MSKEAIQQRRYDHMIRLNERRMGIVRQQVPNTRMTVLARNIRAMFAHGLPVGWGV